MSDEAGAIYEPDREGEPINFANEDEKAQHYRERTDLAATRATAELVDHEGRARWPSWLTKFVAALLGLFRRASEGDRIRTRSRPGPYTVESSTRATATAASSQIVPAATGIEPRFVWVSVAPTALIGAHVAFGEDATTAHGVVYAGQVLHLNTLQSVHVLRASTANVPLEVWVAAPN